jgi:hypothetical protein
MNLRPFDDSLDRQLAAALLARPTHVPAADLAEVVQRTMRLGRTDNSARLAAIDLAARRNHLLWMSAALVLITLAAIGCAWLADLISPVGALTDSIAAAVTADDQVTEAMAVDDFARTTTSALPLVGVIAVMALVATGALTSLSSNTAWLR